MNPDGKHEGMIVGSYSISPGTPVTVPFQPTKALTEDIWLRQETAVDSCFVCLPS